MQYLHIKNLEKYHPGYKDRKLQWCKAYFTMLNADPEVEMLPEVDKWRFVAFIMLELQLQKPVPLKEDWLVRKGFNLKKRPISKTLQMLHNFIEVGTEQCETCVLEESRVEKSRVDQITSVFSQETANLLDRVFKKDFNIYKFINKLKKDKKIELPEEVVIKVCEAFLHYKDNITNQWGWFAKVVAEVSKEYFANKNIQENAQFKKAEVAQSLKEIMAGIK